MNAKKKGGGPVAYHARVRVQNVQVRGDRNINIDMVTIRGHDHRFSLIEIDNF